MEDNILFGKELDIDRMSDVVHASALEEDLEALPDGLQTEIGGESETRQSVLTTMSDDEQQNEEST